MLLLQVKLSREYCQYEGGASRPTIRWPANPAVPTRSLIGNMRADVDLLASPLPTRNLIPPFKPF